MEYNNYYPNQPVHPPPSAVNHQHSGIQMQQQQPPSGGQMMHSNMSGQNIRQTIPQGPPNHHPQLQQQLIGHHPQQIPSHQHHPNYHQIQPPHPHGPPLSHSGSPHPQQQPQQQQQQHNHQPNLSGPSPHQHHIHPQSPHHHIAPQTHMQQPSQQLNQIVRPNLGPSYLSHPQPGLQQPPNHHQNFFGGGGGGGPTSQPNLHHFPQQNQNQHPHHIQHHHPSSVIHHVSNSGPNHHLQQGFGRNSPYYQNMLQTEMRIMELNRRLQMRPISRHPISPLPNNPYDDSQWWERFASEFFEDDATLTIRVIEDKEIFYTIGRTLIPRFFRTYFDGGVTDLSINLRNPREILLPNNIIALDCDQTYIITSNSWRHSNQNPGAIVHTEGHLSLEFVSNSFDNLLVKTWKFLTKGCREYIDRSMVAAIGYSNAISEPITRHGLTKSTISYLKMCMIIEPMQELMSQHKQTSLVPRECLRRHLVERFKYRSDDNRTTTNKRRKRKPSAAPITGATTNKRTKVNANNNVPNNSGLNNMIMSPTGTPNFTLASQDVMVVGEPSMMGGDFGDDNERMITRLENTQYEPTASTPLQAEESNSMTIPTNSESNGLTNNNNNIESDSDNQTLSPSLLQQRQQQPAPQRPQSQSQEVPLSTTPIDTMPQQSGHPSPTVADVHALRINSQDELQEDQVQSRDNQVNLIEDSVVQEREDNSQEENQPVISAHDEIHNQVIPKEHQSAKDEVRLNESSDKKVHPLADSIDDSNMVSVNSVEQIENHTHSIQPLNEESNSNSQLPCSTAPATSAMEQQQPVDNGVA